MKVFVSKIEKNLQVGWNIFLGKWRYRVPGILYNMIALMVMVAARIPSAWEDLSVG